MSKQKYPQASNAVTTSNIGEKRSTLTIKRNGYTQVKANAKRNRKRDEAEVRQSKYDSLTIAEKFSTLIEGGSKKQRAKLTKQLANSAAKGIPTAVVAKVEAVAVEVKAKKAKKAKVEKA
jgi:hypothetical protein